ncbi:galactokinase-like isoform X2 [Paramacrobiotus metropolitanus]|uniref:galactokinase-like isoform X2 n=1 Tax=Paramacrobiotus metropolitanus TaxID=2943436 RepID=UPI002446440C|nr:galactokinase-like isoform X2 [Paramacrobiotus metropolitanus]
MEGAVTATASVAELLASASEAFTKRFSTSPVVYGLAPGRVNLIGEHTDYNDGFVLPMAVPMTTIVAGAVNTNPSGKSTIVTVARDADSPKEITIDSGESLQSGQPAWANYVKGVLANFSESAKLPSFDAVIVSSVPLGGGLSSSASLEVATYMFLSALTETGNIDHKKAAAACQKAEHDFANMPCGIMDQMIACLAKEGHALLLDCRSLETDYIPLDDPESVILITNSNVRHTLSGSEYPERRQCCEKAARILGVPSLREVTLATLEANKSKLDSTTYHRARHVVTETERTREAADALKSRDYQLFGRLMNESHASLRNDYEVSCVELDQLVDAAQSVPGVFGSRMTGGGFGGCTVTLVKRAAVPNAIKAMKDGFTGTPSFYVCQASTGCRTGTFA